MSKFMGYHNCAYYPLQEEYYKRTLDLLKPWILVIDNLKYNGSYADSPEGYMRNYTFPKNISLDITRDKLRQSLEFHKPIQWGNQDYISSVSDQRNYMLDYAEDREIGY